MKRSHMFWLAGSQSARNLVSVPEGSWKRPGRLRGLVCLWGGKWRASKATERPVLGVAKASWKGTSPNGVLEASRKGSRKRPGRVPENVPEASRKG